MAKCNRQPTSLFRGAVFASPEPANRHPTHASSLCQSEIAQAEFGLMQLHQRYVPPNGSLPSFHLETYNKPECFHLSTVFHATWDESEAEGRQFRVARCRSALHRTTRSLVSYWLPFV